MKWTEAILWVVGAAAATATIVFFALTFGVDLDVYLVKNPTQEQVEALVRGNPNNRVWFDDAAQLYQGSSLIKMSFRARNLEGDRISDFLDEVGVEYELIKEGY